MTISEPTTLITDFVLAGISALFGILLLRARTRGSTLLWSIGFIALTGAGLTGGTFHGFRLMMSEGSYRTLHNITDLLIGACVVFMLAGAYAGPRSRHALNTKWLIAGLILTIAGVAAQQRHVAIHPSFNHNDLFHVVEIAAIYCFFRGARMTA